MKTQFTSFANTAFKNIATLGFIGYLPVAPGTFGTLAAVLFYGILKPSLPISIGILLATIIIGTIAADQAEKLLGEKDSGQIVIDEFAGYAVSIMFLPATLLWHIAAFILFRIFDILKPPPIRRIEKTFPGGLGVMADDLMAGIYANIALQIWKYIN